MSASVAPHNPLMSRRQLTIAGAGLAAGLGFAGAFGPLVSAAKAAGTSSEDALLDQLYKDALAEGGQLVAYMGGDTAHQNDSTRAAFLARFPEMKFTLKTDLSKYLDGMIDNQLARHRLEPDMAVLQTLWDFPRWKHEGVLLPYQPLGWEHVYPVFKDPAHHYVALLALSFSNVVNTHLVPLSQAPLDPRDYLAPALRGKLVFTYPDDDDFVHFVFKNIIDQYGWGYMDDLMAQEPTFVRGIGTTAGLIAAGKKAATFAGFWSFADKASGVVWLPPRRSSFASWGQTAAIFRAAKHPAAARLYMSWALSKPVQSATAMWPVRDDVPVQGGYKPLSSYNTDPRQYPTVMADRTAAELFRSQIRLYVGDPQGPDPALS